MHWRIVAAGVIAALALGPVGAAASDASDALAVVQKFAAASNGTDRELYASYCAPDAIFIDHVPPYVFRGPRACQDEWDAAAAWVAREKLAVSDYGRLSKPSFVDVSGDRVYAVYPVTAAMTDKGRKVRETGAWTFVLRRGAADWRIVGVTWTTFSFTPIAGRRSR